MLSKILSVLGGDLIGEVGDLIRQWQDGKISKDELAFKIRTFEAANEQAIKIAQIELNKEEAKHKSVFISGWRPFLGWCMALGFAMNFVIGPLLSSCRLSCNRCCYFYACTFRHAWSWRF